MLTLVKGQDRTFPVRDKKIELPDQGEIKTVEVTAEVRIVGEDEWKEIQNSLDLSDGDLCGRVVNSVSCKNVKFTEKNGTEITDKNEIKLILLNQREIAREFAREFIDYMKALPTKKAKN